MLKDWKHSGFSIESETRLFSKTVREALVQYVVRGATCAEKIQYDPASDTVIWTAAPKSFYKGKTATFKCFEFVDQLVAHLPPRGVQLVCRYGAYAGKVRKQWQERPNIYCLAPENWQKGHPNQSQIVHLSAQNAMDQCRLCRLSRIQKSLQRLLTGQVSKNEISQRLSALVHLLSLHWRQDNTPKR